MEMDDAECCSFDISWSFVCSFFVSQRQSEKGSKDAQRCGTASLQGEGKEGAQQFERQPNG